MEYAQLLSLLQGLRPGVDFEKEEGLIDRLGGLSDALEYLYKKIRREKKGKRSAD